MRYCPLCLTLFALTLVACGGPNGPPILIDDVRILAPAIGGHASVAYFTINNGSDDTVTVLAVGSPQFGSVEMHETIMDGGVSRMRRIDSVEVAGRSTLAFSPGGKHIMLMQPAADVQSGARVTLEIQTSDNLLLVEAELQDRMSQQ